MEDLSERQEQLLKAIVEEYVKTAQPVSSHLLVDKHRLDLSTATVRNEMLAMEQDGLLAQPHTSAGRIPSEQGLRYYLQHLVKGKELPATTKKRLDQIRKQYREHDERYVKELARKIAEIVDLAVIVGFSRSFIYYTGITNVLRQPEFSQTGRSTHIAEVVDHLDQVLEMYYGNIGDHIDILLGQENPFSKDCGTVITRTHWGIDGEGVFGILGPVRMDYPQAQALIHYATTNLLTT